jgi:hypothetical protein
MLWWVELGRRCWDVEAAAAVVESSSWSSFACCLLLYLLGQEVVVVVWLCGYFSLFQKKITILVNISFYFVMKTTNKPL